MYGTLVDHRALKALVGGGGGGISSLFFFGGGGTSSSFSIQCSHIHYFDYSIQLNTKNFNHPTRGNFVVVMAGS